MKDSLNHALVITTLLERDIARICASGNEAQQGLAADCAEHRQQLANKLRHIKHMEDIATVIDSEQSFKAGDFNGDIAVELPTENLKSGSYGYRFQIGETPVISGKFDVTYKVIDNDENTVERRYSDDINPVSDKAYHADLVRRENVEMWRNCDRKKNWLGCGLACVAAGVILGALKIWFTCFSDL